MAGKVIQYKINCYVWSYLSRFYKKMRKYFHEKLEIGRVIIFVKKKQYPINIIKPYKLSGQCMCDYGLMDTAFVSVFDFKKKGGQ